MRGLLTKTASKLKPSPAQALEGMKMVLDAYQENRGVIETEKTKRAEIDAQKEVELERLRGQRAILETYLKESFAERKMMINGMFDALDKGIDSGNLELIQQSLGAIVTIAKESPLAQLQNFMEDFKNPDVKEITF
jgi:soluble cytochrome b562